MGIPTDGFVGRIIETAREDRSYQRSMGNEASKTILMLEQERMTNIFGRVCRFAVELKEPFTGYTIHDTPQVRYDYGSPWAGMETDPRGDYTVAARLLLRQPFSREAGVEGCLLQLGITPVNAQEAERTVASAVRLDCAPGGLLSPRDFAGLGHFMPGTESWDTLSGTFWGMARDLESR